MSLRQNRGGVASGMTASPLRTVGKVAPDGEVQPIFSATYASTTMHCMAFSRDHEIAAALSELAATPARRPSPPWWWLHAASADEATGGGAPEKSSGSRCVDIGQAVGARAMIGYTAPN